MSFKRNLSKIKNFFDIHFPIPKYLSFDPVAIDISPGVIRLLKLKQTSQGLVPCLNKEIKFDSGIDFSEGNLDKNQSEDIVSILKKIKSDFNLNYVVTSLPEQKTYVYNTRLPREALYDMVPAIRFDIEENVPLDVKSVNFDYDVIKYEEKYIHVVISVFPKEVISMYTDLLKRANLTPISFQSESASVARSVVKTGDMTPYLLIRIMENQTNIAVAENGVVQYATKLSLSGEKIKNNDPQEEKKLSQELNKTLIYWFTSKKDTLTPHKIEKAIIVGNYINNNLISNLENSLKVDLNIGDVWANCFSLDDYIPSINKDEALDYSVAIGLAIKAIKYI